MEGQRDRDLSQATRVGEGCGENLGLVQINHSAFQGTRRVKRRAQVEPEIDGLFVRVVPFWQMREGLEGLLEVAHGFAVG
jgi:hypothetical protein